MPAPVFTVKACVKANGNPPRLFIPPGRESCHVPQVPQPTVHNSVVMDLQQFLCCWRDFNREGLTGHTPGLNQLFHQRCSSLHRVRRNTFCVVHHWLGHGAGVADQQGAGSCRRLSIQFCPSNVSSLSGCTSHNAARTWTLKQDRFTPLPVPLPVVPAEGLSNKNAFIGAAPL